MEDVQACMPRPDTGQRDDCVEMYPRELKTEVRDRRPRDRRPRDRGPRDRGLKGRRLQDRRQQDKRTKIEDVVQSSRLKTEDLYLPRSREISCSSLTKHLTHPTTECRTELACGQDDAYVVLL